MNDPDIYLDENNMRMMTNIRNSFNRLANALIEEGKNEMAIEVVDRCFELIPQDISYPEYFAMELADSYFNAGAKEKGKAALEQALELYNDELGYYFSLDNKFLQTKSVNEEIQRNLFYLQRMERTARNSGDTEFAKIIGDAFQSHIAKLGMN
jgi:tetratricopeptide (TPR) repeat protein